MKNIYITWHYNVYGIAFFKHILSAFYAGKANHKATSIYCEGVSQIEMHEVFNSPIKKGFVFDKVYYLTSPQETFDKIASRRFYYRYTVLGDSQIIKDGTLNIWQELLSLDWIKEDDCLSRELEYVYQKYPEQFEIYKTQIWRDIQHFPIKSQIKWLIEMSNAAELYKDKIDFVNLKINNLKDPVEIAEKLNIWLKKLKKDFEDSNFFINISLGSPEAQVVWHILGELNMLPTNSRLITVYDIKSEGEDKRFKCFNIQEVPTNIMSNISNKINIFENSKSPVRKLASLKIKNFINSDFTILILGERGVGKTKLVNDINLQQKKYEIISANCASFADDTMAESELFGYIKGSFTGAYHDNKGLFQHANKNILFLDEVHHLSKRVQAKLMIALQTDDNNNFKIRRLGAIQSETISCKVIFATNKKIEELKKLLLPDFYDRISQLIIEIPSLRETPNDRIEDWRNIWKQMKFGEREEAPNKNSFVEWLLRQDLYGNFRDLQTIAIYYKTFSDFNTETQRATNYKDVEEYTIAEFEKYHTDKMINNGYNFSTEKTIAQMESEYHKEFVQWALKIFGNNLKDVERYFKNNGSKIDYRTLLAWKKET